MKTVLKSTVTMLLVVAVIGTDFIHIQICGTNLSNVLRLICGGEFYVREDIKKRTNDFHNLADHILNLKRGIVDECCLNPCSPRELSQYCKDPERALVTLNSTFGQHLVTRQHLTTIISTRLGHVPSPTTSVPARNTASSSSRPRWFFNRRIGPNPTRNPHRIYWK